MEKKEILQEIQKSYFYIRDLSEMGEIRTTLEQKDKNIRAMIKQVDKEVDDQDTFLSPKKTLISVAVLGFIFALVLGLIFESICQSMSTPYQTVPYDGTKQVIVFIISFVAAWQIVRVVEKKKIKEKSIELQNKKNNLNQYYSAFSKLMNESNDIENRLISQDPKVFQQIPDNRRFILVYYGELYEIIRTGQAKNLAEGIKILEDRWRDKKEVTEMDNLAPLDMFSNPTSDNMHNEIETLKTKVNNFFEN